MAIDNPRDAFEQQYMQEEQDLPRQLAVLAGKLMLPQAGLAFDILQKVIDRLTRPSPEERFRESWKLVVNEIEHLQTTKADLEDVERAIQRLLRRDVEERDDKKRERYIKIIGNALRSETQIQDVTTFIQTVEQLNERDVTVLKVLNKVMNRQEDWKHSHAINGVKLHPSNLLNRRQELAKEIALALGQRVEKNDFNRELGYAICHRLQGFGLANEVQPDVRELPFSDYCFRLSATGITLLRLLGEGVGKSGSFYTE